MSTPTQNTIAEIESDCGTEIKIVELVFNPWRKELAIKVKSIRKAVFATRRSWRRTKLFISPDQVERYITSLQDIEQNYQIYKDLNEKAVNENWDREQTRQNMVHYRWNQNISAGQILFNHRGFDSNGKIKPGSKHFDFAPHGLGTTYENPAPVVQAVSQILADQISDIIPSNIP